MTKWTSDENNKTTTLKQERINQIHYVERRNTVKTIKHVALREEIRTLESNGPAFE